MSGLSCCFPQTWLKPCMHHRFRTFCFSTAAATFVNCRLDSLVKLGHLVDARKLFNQMIHRDEFSWNTMIAAYARYGQFDKAHQLFEEVPKRVPVYWSSLIAGYARHGAHEESFGLFRKMQFDGMKPDQYTLGSVLRACSISSSLQVGKQVHAHVMKTHFDANVYVVTGLIDMYSKCGKMGEAEYLFDGVCNRKNQVLWTAVISGYSHNGDGVSSMNCFCDMRREGVEPNQFTFPSVLTACATAFAHDFGMQVHGCIIQCGFGANVFVRSALIDMYAKCRDLSYARRVLEGAEAQDVVSWNCLIAGCVRQGCGEEALCLFRQMHMVGVGIDDFTFSSILNSLASVKIVKNGKSVHGLIVKLGFQGYVHVANALIDMYAKLSMLNCAFAVFNNMCEPDVVSWTSLITGCAHHGSYEESVKLFIEMKIIGIKLDEIIVASVLSACAGITALEFGRQVHGIFIRSGFKSSLSIENSLITLYAKCGSIEDALQVFNMMHIRDVVSWTALIVSHARNGMADGALCLYEQMLNSGIEPDYVTFIGLLFSCSHAGLLEEGTLHFRSMYEVYGIRPGPEHYACMIDLLGRAGKIKEAEELLNSIKFEPDPTIWKALLGACKVHGNVELGEKAARNLFELEPENAVPYVTLSNMYSAAGRWEDAARIRRLMKVNGVSKEPGCSWIEANCKIHIFMAEDRSHPRSKEIYSKVEEYMNLIKEAGYVPETSFALHDVDEEGKARGLAYHSEKLAVAFGLLTVPYRAPIRIYKNLRVCGDCHSAMKFVSKVTKRRIIMRDLNCFHHFNEGLCSCRDYW